MTDYGQAVPPALGLRVWRLRSRLAEARPESSPATASVPAGDPANKRDVPGQSDMASATSAPAPSPAAAPATVGAKAAEAARAALGADDAKARPASPPVIPAAKVAAPVPAVPTFPTDIPTDPAERRQALAALAATVAGCTACPLHEGRTQTVFGTGALHPRWMIVGEGPGETEDREGQPFVGRAGQLLDAMLAAAGFAREEVYIANVVKCRPPRNRTPHAAEAETCGSYLAQQIALVQPKMIIALGASAAQHLLAVTTPVGRLRGTLHTLPSLAIPVVVTYHPAYLLREPAQKRRAWDDLKLALRAMPAEG